ncbi:MAG TPA: PfkB family carbohydrate kinase, partial [Acidimicrobiales bacterium]|nr:PfkB family carbohydrate kinase [Acidimicrobiales bacterium]
RPVVALSLSDLFCVERHRDEFAELVVDGVDLLFANEAEATTLFDARTLEEAAEAARAHGVVAVFTRGGTGSLVADQDQVRSVPAWPVTDVVDTTGAGDLFAAGFLHGFTHGADLPACARLGSLAAAEVIGHLGARPEVSLASLAEEAGLAL